MKDGKTETEKSEQQAVRDRKRQKQTARDTERG